VFDLSAGNLFVVRVAGNVVDDDVLGSLEYSVEHLNVPLIVVLGHSMCGAVGAADDSLKSGVIPDQSIGDLVEKILPAIRPLPADHSLATAVAANAQHSARQIQARSAVISRQTAAGTVMITQATYGLGSRRVTFF
jgi:carbonic anhydrase